MKNFFKVLSILFNHHQTTGRKMITNLGIEDHWGIMLNSEPKDSYKYINK